VSDLYVTVHEAIGLHLTTGLTQQNYKNIRQSCQFRWDCRTFEFRFSTAFRCYTTSLPEPAFSNPPVLHGYAHGMGNGGHLQFFNNVLLMSVKSVFRYA